MADFRYNRGVTLIEMLVVLGVIVVLSSIAVTLTRRVENQSKENVLRNTFALLTSSLHEYYEFKGQYPPQAEQDPTKALAHMESMVRELRSVPAARQVLDKVSASLVKNETGTVDVQYVCDPWGTVMDYLYAADNTVPELISAGPDKLFGTADDISSKGKR
jgi:prepilin-type N-terminal cleavage/methylation domain-containing protein